MDKCIVCKQEVKAHEVAMTPHGIVHTGVCLSFYDEKSKTPHLSESDIGKELEQVQIL